MGPLLYLPSNSVAYGIQITFDEFEIQAIIFSRKQSPVFAYSDFNFAHSFFGMAFCNRDLHHIYSVIFGLQKSTYMTYNIAINIMPLKDLLDPQGKAVLAGLHNLGISKAIDVRIGKRIVIQIEASSEEEAISNAKLASEKLLANQVMEQFEISVIA